MNAPHAARQTRLVRRVRWRGEAPAGSASDDSAHASSTRSAALQFALEDALRCASLGDNRRLYLVRRLSVTARPGPGWTACVQAQWRDQAERAWPGRHAQSERAEALVFDDWDDALAAWLDAVVAPLRVLVSDGALPNRVLPLGSVPVPRAARDSWHWQQLARLAGLAAARDLPDAAVDLANEIWRIWCNDPASSRAAGHWLAAQPAGLQALLGGSPPNDAGVWPGRGVSETGSVASASFMARADDTTRVDAAWPHAQASVRNGENGHLKSARAAAGGEPLRVDSASADRTPAGSPDTACSAWNERATRHAESPIVGDDDADQTGRSTAAADDASAASTISPAGATAPAPAGTVSAGPDPAAAERDPARGVSSRSSSLPVAPASDHAPSSGATAAPDNCSAQNPFAHQPGGAVNRSTANGKASPGNPLAADGDEPTRTRPGTSRAQRRLDPPRQLTSPWGRLQATAFGGWPLTLNLMLRLGLFDELAAGWRMAEGAPSAAEQAWAVSSPWLAAMHRVQRQGAKSEHGVWPAWLADPIWGVLPVCDEAVIRPDPVAGPGELTNRTEIATSTGHSPLASALRDWPGAGATPLPGPPPTDIAGWGRSAWLTMGRTLHRHGPWRNVWPLLLRPAWMHLSTTHLDLVYPLTQADPAARRLGLDLDPGWVRPLGRIVTLHFEDVPSAAPLPEARR